MSDDNKSKKALFDNREAILFQALENIRQKALDLLYGSEKSASDIIREAADEELLRIETRQGFTRIV